MQTLGNIYATQWLEAVRGVYRMSHNFISFLNLMRYS